MLRLISPTVRILNTPHQLSHAQNNGIIMQITHKSVHITVVKN